MTGRAPETERERFLLDILEKMAPVLDWQDQLFAEILGDRPTQPRADRADPFVSNDEAAERLFPSHSEFLELRGFKFPDRTWLPDRRPTVDRKMRDADEQKPPLVELDNFLQSLSACTSRRLAARAVDCRYHFARVMILDAVYYANHATRKLVISKRSADVRSEIAQLISEIVPKLKRIKELSLACGLGTLRNDLKRSNTEQETYADRFYIKSVAEAALSATGEALDPIQKWGKLLEQGKCARKRDDVDVWGAEFVYRLGFAWFDLTGSLPSGSDHQRFLDFVHLAYGVLSDRQHSFKGLILKVVRLVAALKDEGWGGFDRFKRPRQPKYQIFPPAYVLDLGQEEFVSWSRLSER